MSNSIWEREKSEREQLEKKPEKYTNPTWRTAFDDRQRKEIELCILYANQFAHGTDGHHIRMIVAKMSELLDAITMGKA